MPQPRAAILRRFFSILKYNEYLGEEKSTSDVKIRITAVTASHKPIFEVERGKYINLASE
jgi:hypothetical protein